MYDLKNGSKIIDTPGIKGFGLYDFDEAQLKDCFMEFLKYKNCKYNDCLHKDEPGCDVKLAVDKGLIAKSRYKNYYLNEDIELICSGFVSQHPPNIVAPPSMNFFDKL